MRPKRNASQWLYQHYQEVWDILRCCVNKKQKNNSDLFPACAKHEWHEILITSDKLEFMENNQNAIEVLNDLIQINNDRITGYERAIKELKGGDEDLKTLFLSFIDQSRNIKIALGTEVQVLGGDMEKGTTGSGKIYRAWMDVKAMFTGHDRQTVLDNCEFGEDAAQKAYKSALETEKLPAYLFTLINRQKTELKSAHDEVRALRDQEKLAHENA